MYRSLLGGVGNVGASTRRRCEKVSWSGTSTERAQNRKHQTSLTFFHETNRRDECLEIWFEIVLRLDGNPTLLQAAVNERGTQISDAEERRLISL